MYLKQSTSQSIKFGPFLDSTDGITPETGLTILQADMQLSRDGGAFSQKSGAGNAIHDKDGWYSTSFSVADTATTGEFKLQVAVAGALPVWEKWFILTETAYDALQTGTFNNLSTADVDARLNNIHLNQLFFASYDPDNKPGDTDSYMNRAVEPDGTGLEMRFTTKMLENIAAIAGNLVSGTFTWLTDITATNPGLANIKGNNATQANITEIYINGTGELGGAAAPYILRLKAGDEILISKEGTLSEHIFFIVSGPATDNTGWFTIPGAVDSVGSPALANGTKVTAQAFYPALEAGEITDAVWDELQSGHTTAGTFGKFLDVEVSSVSGGGGLTQQNVRDAMKLTPTAGTPSADSVDEHLDEILLDTGTTIPAQIQSRTKPSADYASATNLATVDTVVDGIQADLDNATDGLGAIKTSVDAVPTDPLLASNYTAPDNAGITQTQTDIANLNDITAASVLAAGDIDTYSLEEALKLVLSASAGVLAGAATTTVTIEAADGSKTRLTATVDADGNRIAVIKDATG